MKAQGHKVRMVGLGTGHQHKLPATISVNSREIGKAFQQLLWEVRMSISSKRKHQRGLQGRPQLPRGAGSEPAASKCFSCTQKGSTWPS